MMMKTDCEYRTRVEAVKSRMAAALLVACNLLVTPGWTAHAWGQPNNARVGILASQLTGTTDEATRESYAPFRAKLAERGWIEGKNVSFEYRRARGDPPKFAEGAAELVGLNVDVIYADSAPAVRAAYEATRTIPIVGLDFTNDPVAAGYAQNYGRPGRNITGVFLDAPEFSGKWLELLKGIVPGLARVLVLWDPSPGAVHLHGVEKIAPSLQVRLQVIEVHTPADIERIFAALRAQPQAVLFLPSPMIYQHSGRLAELTIKHRLPGTSMAQQFAESGGVLSYGPDLASVHERCAALVAKILSGTSPAGLPVERPTKFNLVVNLKSAKALGISIPESILLRADEVIR
jgi:putative ABC transport system substrate-binding protein